ncbi:hypothetical protein ANTPLA_LOCUS4747 [Anthophora plagiata]
MKCTEETWIYSYKPEIELQSSTWAFESETKPTKVILEVFREIIILLQDSPITLYLWKIKEQSMLIDTRQFVHRKSSMKLENAREEEESFCIAKERKKSDVTP